MSRRSRAPAQSVPLAQGPAAPPDDADALHRQALERRAARMGARPVESGAAPAGPAIVSAEDELHRRATELREARLGRAPRPARTEATDDGAVAVTLPVLGMTCRACEVRIAKHVGRLPNVERVSASAVRGEVRVESSGPVATADIAAAIGRAGYAIGRTPWLTRDTRVWATAGAGVLLVAAVALVAQATGIDALAGGLGDLASGGLLVALLLGLAAGVSTCMAMVGGLVLGLSASFIARREVQGAPAGVAARLRPAMVFVAGRVAGYALFGAALGAVGASLAMPPLLTAVLMVAVGLLMTVLGTRLTGLSPRIAGWSPTLPLGLGARLGLAGDGREDPYSDGRAATLGALSFFLPCGFTQAVQVYALSTGSPLLAAGLLGVFAIGTAPGLLALAGLPAVVPTTARPALLRLVGVVVLGFALVNLTSGLRLAGIGLPSLAGFASAAPLPGTLGADGVQSITTYQEIDGYAPANVVIYAGYPTRWTVESSTTASCAASLWVPSVDIRARLVEGPNTFELPPLEAGSLRYTCAMGMYDGTITIVDPPADAPAAGVIEPATAAAASAAEPSPMPGSGAAASAEAPAGDPDPAVQELRTWQDVAGYGPADATIVAGVPTRWTIESKSSLSCAVAMVVPDLGIQRYLEPGDGNVIDLPALEAGRLDYTCSMGMYWGSITIVDG